MSDQSWNNSWEVLPNVFLPGQTIKVEAFFNCDVHWNNTTQSQPKTHANQLISGRFCSVPVYLCIYIMLSFQSDHYSRLISDFIVCFGKYLFVYGVKSQWSVLGDKNPLPIDLSILMIVRYNFENIVQLEAVSKYLVRYVVLGVKMIILHPLSKNLQVTSLVQKRKSNY